MGFLPDLLGGLTDIFGSHPGAEYSDKYNELAKRYAAMNPNLRAEQMQFDTPTRNAMLDAMGQFGDIAGKGGLDAIGRSQIAEANAATGREASSMANAIQARAGSGPARNSGVTLSLMDQAGSEAADRGARAGQAAAAGAEGRQRGALSSYFDAADKAGGAADYINKFNTMLRQGTNEGNFQRGLQQNEGMGQAYTGAYGAARGDQQQWRRGLSDIGRAGDDVGSYAAQKGWI